MNGTVWAFYDEQKRAYCIRGEALPVPADTQLAAILSGVEVVKTWSMLDYVKPQQARRLVGN